MKLQRHIKIEGTSKFQIGEIKNNTIHYDFNKIKPTLIIQKISKTNLYKTNKVESKLPFCKYSASKLRDSASMGALSLTNGACNTYKKATFFGSFLWGSKEMNRK